VSAEAHFGMVGAASRYHDLIGLDGGATRVVLGARVLRESGVRPMLQAAKPRRQTRQVSTDVNCCARDNTSPTRLTLAPSVKLDVDIRPTAMELPAGR